MARADSGFTLVEVLVAIAILALVTAATLGAMSAAVGWGTEGERLLAAQNIAKNQLERWTAVAESASKSGVAGGFDWEVTERPLDDYAPIDLTSAQLLPRQIRVTVRWNEDGEEKSFALETVRVAPGGGGAR